MGHGMTLSSSRSKGLCQGRARVRSKSNQGQPRGNPAGQCWQTKGQAGHAPCLSYHYGNGL